jgi:hypothetical protein
MSKSSHTERALYVMAACFIATIVLWVGVVLIGLYYFAMNEGIPAIVDHIQVGMLVLAALCGLIAVAMLVRFIVLIVKCHRAEPPQV